jgi:predicted membrane protein (TIGR00267 family)
MVDSESDELPERRIMNIGDRVDDRIETLGEYIEITRSKGILRRYFVMNAFDGAMTSLGVVIGSYVTGILDPADVMGVILVSGVAMAVSGFTGTFMTESAERNHSLNELEDAMLTDLESTRFGKASRVVSVFAAIVDGAAPFLAAIPCILPFLLVQLGLLDIYLGFTISVAASLSVLFVLGFYLGKLSESNLVVSGLKMVVAGIVVALIALILGGH